jgi:hypothetical protein
MATFREALRMKERLSKQLLSKKHIIGVGVGYAKPGVAQAGGGGHRAHVPAFRGGEASSKGIALVVP